MTHPSEAAYYAAIRATHDWWKAADAAMKYLIKTGSSFSADDLRHLLRDAGEPPTPNAWGGLFRAYSTQNLIRRIGGGTSTQPKRNGGYRHQWVGNTQKENQHNGNN